MKVLGLHLFLTFLGCSLWAQIDLTGGPGEAKNLYDPPPPPQGDSPECQRAKAYLRTHGKRVPKDCDLAIHLAAQEYVNEIFAEKKAEEAREQAEAEQHLQDAFARAKKASERTQREAKQKVEDARIKSAQQILEAL